MSRYTLVLAPAAEDDIQQAFVWYGERNRLAAEAFRDEVFEAIERLADARFHPATDEAGVRKRLLKRFPYSVLYEIAEETITVLAVAHHRRKPAYWKSAST